MKTTIILSVVVVVIGLHLIRTSHTPVSASAATFQEAASHSSDFYHIPYLHVEPASDHYRYADLQLYPIFASALFLDQHQYLGPYLSLKEALGQHKIVITELTKENSQSHGMPTDQLDQAEVNKLFVENISADTIIILGGEVVRGGKQDRMIAEDFMVLPHSGKIDIGVYCVEHSRWTPSDDELAFESTLDVAPNKVRKAAQGPEPQNKVWEEVEALNKDFDVESSTGALAYVVGDTKMLESIEPCKEGLQDIQWPENVVGVMAIRGSELLSIEVFAQPQLFTKYYPSLLNSYCSGIYEPSNSTLMSYTEAQASLQNLIGSEEALDLHIQKHGTQLKNGGYRIHFAAY